VGREERLKKLLEALVTDHEKADAVARYATKEAEFERSKRVRLTLDDFRTLRIIGRGAFGVVIVCFMLFNSHGVRSRW